MSSKYDDLALDDLGEELAKRKLLKTGLKADLIQRLVDDDWRRDVADAAIDGGNIDVDMKDTPSSVADLDSDSGSRSDSIQGDEPANIIKNKLASCFSSVTYVGSFMASKASQKNVDPGLYINDVGNISLPLTLKDASAIMDVSSQAPFGRGSATVVDTTFRNTKELSSDQFKLLNPAWTTELQNIMKQLGKDLGFEESPSGIKVELYKLLLYEKGALFKAHKDSEKTEGMFGTLVICLPSKHEGGQIELAHLGQKVTFGTAEASEYGQSHIAWYSDVIHEIKPVTEGFRLVLTYNLIRTESRWPNSANMITQEMSRLQDTLKEWARRYDAGQSGLGMLVYMLDHTYSESNLRFERLKGHDELLSRYLREVCPKEGFTLALANIQLKVDQACDQTTEEADRELTMENIIEVSGDTMLSDATISESEIIQSDCFDSYPDETVTEETGNEGVDSTHFYRNTVVILIPAAHKLEFELSNMSSGSVVSWIRAHIKDLELDPGDEETRTRLIEICKREAMFSRAAREVVRACTAVKEPMIMSQAVQRYSGPYGWLELEESLTDSLLVFDLQEVLPSLEQVLNRHTNVHGFVTTIETIRTRFQSKQTAGSSSPLTHELTVWEKEQISKHLDKTRKLSPEDGPQLVNIVKRHGKEIAIERILPLLNKHCDQLMTVLPFLTGLFEASHRKEIPTDATKPVFDGLIDHIIAALSLPAYHPKQSSPEPCWESKTKTANERSLAKQIASLYYQCLSMDRLDHANSVLKWLEVEANTANVSIFPCVLIPYLKALQEITQRVGLQASTTLQQSCQTLLLTFLDRCLGLEPAKPTTWIRPSVECDTPSCTQCPKLNKFLEDPSRVVARFKHFDHMSKKLGGSQYQTNYDEEPIPGERGRWYFSWLVRKVDPACEAW